MNLSTRPSTLQRSGVTGVSLIEVCRSVHEELFKPIIIGSNFINTSLFPSNAVSICFKMYAVCNIN